MALNQKNKRKRRLELWEEDPRCYWCRQLTILKIGPGFSNQATVDHLYNRLDPRRLEKGAADIQVLACYDCNARRGREYQQEQQRRGNMKAFDTAVRPFFNRNHLTYTLSDIYPELLEFNK